jgi:hypothetical protein
MSGKGMRTETMLLLYQLSYPPLLGEQDSNLRPKAPVR